MAKLLRGGRVLVHDEDENVSAMRADILVHDGKIEKVEADIKADASYELLDCTNKLISPGFVDTHHHVWQTQLKGLHADHTLLEYLPVGNFTSSLYQPDDVFYGQLSGLLEALNGGITTLLDFSHVNYGPEHVFAAIHATEVSGIRSVYGYCPTPRLKLIDGSFQPLDLLEPWVMELFGKLAEHGSWARTTLGFAFDGLFLPQPVLKPILDQVYAAGVRVATSHDNSTSMFHHKPSAYKLLAENDLLDPNQVTNWVMVHPTKLQENPIEDVKKNRFFASITPVSELSMGMGTPVPIALNREHEDIQPRCSIGIDCHSIGEAFIPGQLRAQLLAVRQYEHAKVDAKGQWYASMKPNKGHFAGVKDAFNMATLGGARALNQDKEIGTIKPGYKADLVIWDARSPSMLAVSELDPVAAIVIHSQPGDVTGVMVDGQVRKWDGKLLPTEVSTTSGVLAGYKAPISGSLSWDTLAEKVLESRERIIPEAKMIDVAKAVTFIADIFHLDKSNMLDPVTEN